MKPVIVLAIQAALIGLAGAVYDISAYSYIISKYSTGFLPQLFLISGAFGLFIGFVYVFLQSRMNFRFFGLLNLIFIFTILASMPVLFMYIDSIFLDFAFFALMGPMSVIGIIGFRNTSIRVFRFNQTNQLKKIFDTALMIGIAMGSILVPLFVWTGAELIDALYLSAGSVLLGFFIQLYVNRRYKKNFNLKPVDEKAGKPGDYLRIFWRRNNLFIAGFVALSIFTLFLLQYIFLYETSVVIPGERSFSAFLGIFTAASMVVALLIRYYLSPVLLRRFGLKAGLFSTPLVITLLSIMAVFAGMSSGIQPYLSAFPYFLLIILGSRFFVKVSRDSLELPSMKILFQSIDTRQRINIQSKIDSLINELSVFLTGALLVFLVDYASLGIFQLTIILVVASILWMIMAITLNRSYRKSLRLSISRMNGRKEKENFGTGIIDMDLHNDGNPPNLKQILEYAPQSWDGFITRNLKDLLEQGERPVQDLTLQWIDRLNMAEAQNILISFEKNADNTDRQQFRQLIDRFNLKKSDITPELVESLSASANPENRLKAITAIIKNPWTVTSAPLNRLLRDPDYRVRISAIRITGKLKLVEHAGQLIEYLDNEDFYPFASNSLREFSELILDKLDCAYHSPGSSIRLKLRIIRIFGYSDSYKAFEYLLNYVQENHLTLKRESIKALKRLKFEPEEENRDQILHQLKIVTSVVAWNQVMRYNCRKNGLSGPLYSSLSEEVRDSYALLFEILSLLYDEGIIMELKENLLSARADQIGFSREIANFLLEPEIKQFILPLMEEGSVNTVLSRISKRFPVKKYNAEETIREIINRDLNLLHPVTKIHAIRNLKILENHGNVDYLVAQIFNPVESMAEESAGQLKEMDPEKLKEVSKRLDPDKREQLDNYFNTIKSGNPEGQFNKFVYLRDSQLLKGLTNLSLFKLSEEFRSFYLNEGDTLDLTKYFSQNILLYIVEGKCDIKDIEIGHAGNGTDALIKVKLEAEPDKSKLKIMAKTRAILLTIEEKKIRELIFDDEHNFLSVLGIITEFRQEVL